VVICLGERLLCVVVMKSLVRFGLLKSMLVISLMGSFSICLSELFGVYWCM